MDISWIYKTFSSAKTLHEKKIYISDDVKIRRRKIYTDVEFFSSFEHFLCLTTIAVPCLNSSVTWYRNITLSFVSWTNKVSSLSRTPWHTSPKVQHRLDVQLKAAGRHSKNIILTIVWHQSKTFVEMWQMVKKYLPREVGFQQTANIRNQRKVLTSQFTVLNLFLRYDPNL